MRYLILLLSLLAFNASAEQITFNFTWGAVTKDTAGEDLLTGELIGYRVYYNQGSTVGSKFVTFEPDQLSGTLTIQLEPGTYRYSFAATALAYRGGVEKESAMTDVVSFDSVVIEQEFAAPEAPQSFEVTF